MKRRGEKGRQNGCETKRKKKMNDYKATKKVKSLKADLYILVRYQWQEPSCAGESSALMISVSASHVLHSSVRIPLSTKFRDNRVEERREDVESEVEGKWTDNLFSLIRMMRLTARLCSDWGRRSQWHTHTQRRDNRQLSVSATCIITSRDRERRDSCWKAQKGGERQKTRAKQAKVRRLQREREWQFSSCFSPEPATVKQDLGLRVTPQFSQLQVFGILERGHNN